MFGNPHAVHRLYHYRKSIATKPFAARGKNLKRCDRCLLSSRLCTCEFRSQLVSRSAFLLLMYDDEVLKPSNSGRLIADLIPDTWAFLWSRIEVEPQILSLLSDARFMPIVVFPGEYAAQEQKVFNRIDMHELGERRPLFVMLDGRWREAVKMFRKSPYLANLPLLSFDSGAVARYALRKGKRDFQFGTAEVASMALSAVGEVQNAERLNIWFELFVESSLLGRSRSRSSDLSERQRLIDSFCQHINQEVG